MEKQERTCVIRNQQESEDPREHQHLALQLRDAGSPKELEKVTREFGPKKKMTALVKKNETDAN